jgi:hypothetical protein
MIERVLRIPMLGTMTAVVVAVAWFLRPIDRSALFAVHDGQDLVGFVDAGGRIAIEPKLRRVRKPFDEYGVAVVVVHEGRSEWLELIDRNGRVLATADRIGQFARCGLATAAKGSHLFFLDRSGAVPFAFEGEAAYDFGDAGLCCAQQGGKWGYIDGSGKFVIPPEWDDGAVSKVDDAIGPYPVCRAGKWGFADRAGKLVIPLEWDFTAMFDESGLAQVASSKGYGFVDRTGRVVVKPKWEMPFWFDAQKVAAVQQGQKWGAIDRTGKLVIPCVWDGIWRFSEDGLAAAERDGKFGFIDEAGNIAIPIEWDHVEEFGPSGLAVVRCGDKWGYIDRTGKLAIPLEWESAEPFDKAGIAKVSDANRTAFIDRTGKVVVSAPGTKPSGIDSAAGTSLTRLWVWQMPAPPETRPEWLTRALALLDHGDREVRREILFEQYDTDGRLVWSSDWCSERTWMMLAAIGIGLVGVVEICVFVFRKRAKA